MKQYFLFFQAHNQPNFLWFPCQMSSTADVIPAKAFNLRLLIVPLVMEIFAANDNTFAFFKPVINSTSCVSMSTVERVFAYCSTTDISPYESADVCCFFLHFFCQWQYVAFQWHCQRSLWAHTSFLLVRLIACHYCKCHSPSISLLHFSNPQKKYRSAVLGCLQQTDFTSCILATGWLGSFFRVEGVGPGDFEDSDMYLISLLIKNDIQGMG